MRFTSASVRSIFFIKSLLSLSLLLMYFSKLDNLIYSGLKTSESTILTCVSTSFKSNGDDTISNGFEGVGLNEICFLNAISLSY